jgi:hypothetical protein
MALPRVGANKPHRSHSDTRINVICDGVGALDVRSPLQCQTNARLSLQKACERMERLVGMDQVVVRGGVFGGQLLEACSGQGGKSTCFTLCFAHSRWATATSTSTHDNGRRGCDICRVNTTKAAGCRLIEYD